MKRYDGILICSDYDGTLADKTGGVSRENTEAIRRFEELGGLFTIASGRSTEFILDIGRKVPLNAPFMALNGGIIADCVSGNILEICALDEMIRETVYALGYRSETTEIHFWFGNCECAKWTKASGLPLHGAFDDVPGPIYKVLLMQSDRFATVELRDDAISRFGDRFLFERSWPEGLEILPVDGGKGNALRRIKRLCEKRIDKIVGAGDFENDVSLVRQADLGVAVAGALDCVKQAADIIGAGNDEHAIAHIIDELL